MMSRKKRKQSRIRWVLLLLVIMCSYFGGKTVEAKDRSKEGVLILYSDNASLEEQNIVYELVAHLTYHNQKVTYAPVSSGYSKMEQFQYVICYKVEDYKRQFIEELEKKTNILFIGNTLLKDYLKVADKPVSYVESSAKVGKLSYSKYGETSQQTLVREDGFLFLTKNPANGAGEVSVGEYSGYFYAQWEKIAHISVSNWREESVKQAGLAQIDEWLTIESEESLKKYVVISEVYPFQDPDEVLKLVDQLIKQKTPFVISVMPIYRNIDYPAMQHFCDILRYAQANGGTILLHSPVIQGLTFDPDVVIEALTTSFASYVKNGVYPMGLHVPEDWMANEQAMEVMDCFDTVLVSGQSAKPLSVSKEGTRNQSKNMKQWIAPSNVITIEKETLLVLCEEGLYGENLWHNSHSLQLNNQQLYYNKRNVVVNGETKDLTYHASAPIADYEYQRNLASHISKDLSEENTTLMKAVVLISALFILFIIIARYRNKKRFLIHTDRRK